MLLLLPYQKRLHIPQNALIRSVVKVCHILAIPSLDLQKKLANAFDSKSLNKFCKNHLKVLSKQEDS